MKKNLYDEIKRKKPFSVFDILVYAAIVFIIVGFFLIFIVFRSNDSSDGFKIYVNEKEIFVFYYDTCEYEIKEFDGKIEINVFEEKTFSVLLYPFGNKDFNLISVDAKEKTVKVVDANCSNRKDCDFTPEIKDGAGAIYCVPHALKILPIKSEYKPIRTGGL